MFVVVCKVGIYVVCRFAEGTSEALDGGLGEGGRVGAMDQGVDFGTCNFVGEARGAVAFVKWDVCVVIGRASLEWDVTCGLGSETEEG